MNLLQHDQAHLPKSDFNSNCCLEYFTDRTSIKTVYFRPYLRKLGTWSSSSLKLSPSFVETLYQVTSVCFGKSCLNSISYVFE